MTHQLTLPDPGTIAPVRARVMVWDVCSPEESTRREFASYEEAEDVCTWNETIAPRWKVVEDAYKCIHANQPEE